MLKRIQNVHEVRLRWKQKFQRSTQSRKVSKKYKIITVVAKNREYERSRNCENPALDEATLQWFKQARDKNVPLNGPLLVGKAKQFAKP